MKVLGFDTETTGLVKWNEPLTDQPHPIQVGMVLVEYDPETWEKGATSRAAVYVAPPEGWRLDEKVTEVTGITDGELESLGVDRRVALALINQFAQKADLIVGHNLDFDRRIYMALCERLDKPDRLRGKAQLCTMKKATPIVKLPSTNGKAGYKWPRLGEAYLAATGRELVGAHDALVDVEATLAVFEWLAKDHGAMR